MAPIDLLNAGLPQTFNLKKKAVSGKRNKVQRSKVQHIKTRPVCIEKCLPSPWDAVNGWFSLPG